MDGSPVEFCTCGLPLLRKASHACTPEIAIPEDTVGYVARSKGTLCSLNLQPHSTGHLPAAGSTCASGNFIGFSVSSSQSKDEIQGGLTTSFSAFLSGSLGCCISANNDRTEE